MAGAAIGQTRDAGLETLIGAVARGDQAAFKAVCAQAGPAVFGVVRAVVRDPCQTEEVCQEVLLEVWRAASRFEPGKGSALAWVTTIAHRRAVDRVRAEHRLAERQVRAAWHQVAYDEVAEAVEARLDRERVRLGSARCPHRPPRQSRSRISPSRILVLTVPSGAASSAATSRRVYPP